MLALMKEGRENARVISDQEKHKDIFSSQVAKLSNMRVYTLDSFLEQQHEALTVHLGVGPVKENMPWVKNNPAVKDLKQSLALLRALTPAQRADPKPQLGSVERAQAVEIAAREMPELLEEGANSGEAMMAQILKNFENGQHFHKWLRTRVKQKLPLPATQQEANAMMIKAGNSKQETKKARQRMVKQARRRQRRRR